MTDREKTIAIFEYEVNKAYSAHWDFIDLLTEDGKKILEILKENEIIKPKAVMGTSIYSCGKCDHSVAKGMNFCPVCGCLIDWKNEECE